MMRISMTPPKKKILMDSIQRAHYKEEEMENVMRRIQRKLQYRNTKEMTGINSMLTSASMPDQKISRAS